MNGVLRSLAWNLPAGAFIAVAWSMGQWELALAGGALNLIGYVEGQGVSMNWDALLDCACLLVYSLICLSAAMGLGFVLATLIGA